MKSAKIWVVLLLFAGFYKLREFMGPKPDSNFSEQLNDASSEALGIAIWLLAIAAVFLLGKLLFGSSADSEDDEPGE